MSAKYTWSGGIILAATLAAGCTGMIDTPVPGKANANGVDPGIGPGAGGTTGMGGPGTDPTVCVPGVPQTTQLPRLTNVQYENTLLDLLGVQGTASMLAPDTDAVDQRAWEAYRTAAQTISAQVMADANLKGRVVSCTPEGDGSACATQVIQTFGQRAFRRPLTELEVARFTKLFTDRVAITPTGSFDETMELVLRSFLISPTFLLRSEITETPSGQYLALSGYEVANRLSYMLLGTMPDDTLFAAAAANALTTPDQIRAQAIRLLQEDPRARARITDFHEHYMHMGPGTRWSDYLREVPGFSAGIVPMLSEETNRLFDYIVFQQGGTFRDFLTSPVAFVNTTTAPLYGLDPAAYGADFVQVNLDAAQRPGVFTRAGFLASHAVVNRPSPILRGAFLQEYVLCTEIGSPPPGAEGTALPEVSPTASNRERVDAQTASTECAACHLTLINPTGHTLEAFDALGQYRVADQFSGQPVNTSASVFMGDELGNVQVSGPAELFDKIAGSRDANLCYARAMVQAGYGRGLTSEDSCVAEDMATKLTAGGYRILDLLADLTVADSFRYRAVPEAMP